MATSPKKAPAKPKPAPPPAAAKRPADLAHGRWLGDLGRLSTAEERLVACSGRGEIWYPEGWDWENPVRPEADAKTPANTIRASLIRFLALGGDADHPVHEEGVMVWGAWIEGALDLHQCRTSVRLNLKYCHFADEPDFGAAHLPELILSGSWMPGLFGDRLRVTGGVFLREGFEAAGEVRLPGAQIAGNLDCCGGIFSDLKGDALNADGIKVTGDVFLHTGFESAGEVRLLGAQIGGDLECSGGTFSNPGDYALSADRISVTGGLFLREAKMEGAIGLSAAKIGSLNDDADCWAAKGHVLDGLHYERIIGPTDAASRITWLKTQRTDHLDKRDWTPQPWEQLIKTLRDMGHPAEAAEVAVEKQRMMRRAERIGTRHPNTAFKQPWRRWLDAWWNPWSNRLARGFHDFYGWIAGYGYRPTRIVGRMVMLWLICALAFEGGREFGYFGPSDPLVNSSAATKECGGPGEKREDKTAKAFWHTPACPTPPEYSTLFPFAYSADLILPLVDLQQDSEWAPIVINENGDQLFWGYILRALMWFEILFGWFASLMFVAIVSRLVEKD